MTICEIIWIFYVFFYEFYFFLFFWIFFLLFWFFLDFSVLLWIFLNFLINKKWTFLDLFDFIFLFFSKLLTLLINFTEVTTEHQKWPKIITNSVKRRFFARRPKKASAEGLSSPQELEVSPRSGLYLLAELNLGPLWASYSSLF